MLTARLLRQGERHCLGGPGGGKTEADALAVLYHFRRFFSGKYRER